MVDAVDSKSSEGDLMPVRVRPSVRHLLEPNSSSWVLELYTYEITSCKGFSPFLLGVSQLPSLANCLRFLLQPFLVLQNSYAEPELI